MFGRIVLGLLIMVSGGAMIYFSANLVESLGRSRRAEEKLGGTRQMWILFGFCGVVIGGLVMLGVISFSNPAELGVSGF